MAKVELCLKFKKLESRSFACIAKPVTEKLRRRIEKEVLRLLETGMPKEEILKQLTSKYGFRPRKHQTKKSTTARNQNRVENN